MTCKDCIHYEVCYYHDFEDCEHFKCKSEKELDKYKKEKEKNEILPD